MNHPEQDNTDLETLSEKLTLILPYLNERQQRLLLALRLEVWGVVASQKCRV